MKKQALLKGSIGVVATLSMSLFAITPVMADGPLTYLKGTSTSSSVEVQLTVINETTTVQITKPQDNSRIVGRSFPVESSYTKANTLQYEVTRLNEDSTTTTYTLPLITVSADPENPVSGTNSFTFDIDDFDGEYGDYIISVRAEGSETSTDSVRIRVDAFDFVVKGKDSVTNDPIITIEDSPGVHHAKFQVYDEDDNPIFDEPITVVLNPGASTDATMPLSKYGVPNGEYRIVGTPYNEANNIVDHDKERTVQYEVAPAPEVPDTGSFFGALNLSRQDMVSTGLALLFVCGFFGILLIIRRSKNQKRR